MFKLLVTSIIFFALIAGCSTNSPPATNATPATQTSAFTPRPTPNESFDTEKTDEKTRRFTDHDHGYSIDYNYTWRFDPRPMLDDRPLDDKDISGIRWRLFLTDDTNIQAEAEKVVESDGLGQESFHEKMRQAIVREHSAKFVSPAQELELNGSPFLVSTFTFDSNDQAYPVVLGKLYTSYRSGDEFGYSFTARSTDDSGLAALESTVQTVRMP